MREKLPTDNDLPEITENEEPLFIDPEKLMNTSSLTPVENCRSPNPKRLNEAFQKDVHVSRDDYAEATQICFQIIEHVAAAYQGNVIGHSVSFSEDAFYEITLLSDEETRPAVQRFVGDMQKIFEDSDEFAFDPENLTFSTTNEDGIFLLAEQILHKIKAPDDTAFVEHAPFGTLYKNLNAAYERDIDAPRWRRERILEAAEAEKFDPKLAQLIQEHYAELPYPHSCKELLCALSCGAFAMQSHLLSDQTPVNEARVAQAVTQEEGLICFNVELLNIRTPDDFRIFKLLERYFDELEVFDTDHHCIHKRWIIEEQDELIETDCPLVQKHTMFKQENTVSACYTIACKHPSELLAVLSPLFVTYNIAGPEDITLNPCQEGGTFAEKYAVQINRGKGLVKDFAGTMLALPAKQFASRQQMEAYSSIIGSALIPASIKRIADIIHWETKMDIPTQDGVHLIH